MKKNIWLLIALIVVIFVSGAATGFFAGQLFAPKHSFKRNKSPRSTKDMELMFQNHICKRLKLTDEQKKSAQPFIAQWLDEMKKLRRAHAPQYTAAFNNFYAKIVLILSTEQKEILEKMHKKFTKHSSPPPPPPPSESFNNTTKGTHNELNK
jgi:hypothetical protein